MYPLELVLDHITQNAQVNTVIITRSCVADTTTNEEMYRYTHVPHEGGRKPLNVP
jgi:hypothetical protein